MPLVSVGFAAALFFGVQRTANHVGTMNSARVFGALLTGIAVRPPSNPLPSNRRGPLSSLLQTIATQPDPDAPSPDEIKRQIASVEVIVAVWRYAMWGVCGAIALMALLSLATSFARGWQLATAVIILLSTAGTLVGLRLLIDPRYGAMPPLPGMTYVAVVAVQSFYGVVLLLMFARRARRVRGGSDLAGAAV